MATTRPGRLPRRHAGSHTLRGLLADTALASPSVVVDGSIGRRARPKDTVAAMHRRPSGEAPPLPRRVSQSTTVLLVLAAVTVGLWAALATDTGARIVTRVDLVPLEMLERARFHFLNQVVDVVVLL